MTVLSRGDNVDVLEIAIVATGVVAVCRDEPVLRRGTNLILTAALVWFAAELVREGRLTREARFARVLAAYMRPTGE